MSSPTLAIVGTGQVGLAVAKSALSLFKDKFAKVIIFSRDIASEKVKVFTDLGAIPFEIKDGIKASDFEGVDVVVNCLGIMASIESKNECAKAAFEANVMVYIPSEWGFDPRTKPTDHNLLYSDKETHTDYISKLEHPQTKTIAIYNGIFLDSILSPMFGIDIANGIFQAQGDANNRFTMTATSDVGNSACQVALLAFNDPNSVPGQVSISGDSKSYTELAEIVEKESGSDAKIEVRSGYWAQIRDELDARAHGRGIENLLDYIRVVLSSGNVDVGEKNENELVNPGEYLWKWKKVVDLVKETTKTA